MSALAASSAACSLVGGATPSTSTALPTTTTLPASFEVGIHTFQWADTAPGVSHVGPDGTVPGRQLITEVRYPTLAGAAGFETKNAPPASVGAPFPVVVFAHGYDTEPSDYAALLDSWVRAGFVVVSPRFPDENAAAVKAAGGPQPYLEEDEFNEPGDLVYVLTQLGSIADQPWGHELRGTLNLSDIALAGQSDGADVVAALSFAALFKSTYRQLPSMPKAVVVMSGTEWATTLDQSVGAYAGGPQSPALLQIQSDADGCVRPGSEPDPQAGTALRLWSDLEPTVGSKWFVTLLGADHLGPYEKKAPWAAVVESVTTRFLELELRWRSSSVSAASVRRAGTRSGVSRAVSMKEVDMPLAAPNGSCGLQQ